MKTYDQLERAIRKTIPYLVLLLFSLMLLGNPVLAQDESSSGEGEFTLEEIVVTGSIIRTTGMETPTPVTVVTLDEVQLLAPTTVIEGLAELPQFYMSATTQTPSPFFESTGAGTLNLRGLASKRTLQLLDGRRVVQSSLFGGPDINLFPKDLLRSVETVTGGATATYGTDAVAGAINYILNTDYEGFRIHTQWGMTEKGDNKNIEYSIAGGFALTDNTRMLISAEKSRQDPIRGYDLMDYDWYEGGALLNNPAAGAGTTPDNPFYLYYPQVRSRSDSLDGIIDFGGAVGQYIFNADGNATPFVLGSPCTAHGCSTVNGGSGTDLTLPYGEITPESGRENFFGYIEHDFSHKLKVYGQVLYGKTYWTQKTGGGAFPNPPGPAFDRAFTIYSGNPFLPADMQQIMTDNGIASALFGRAGALEDLGAGTYMTQNTKTLSLTTGLEYNITSGFFDKWQVRSYYQYGESDVEARQRSGIRLDRIYLAADVVIDPATNLPACNVTVTSGLYPDCVPLNLFGRGNASPEAIAWVTGFEPGVAMHADGFISPTETLPFDYISSDDKVRFINIVQHVFDIRADGPIFDGWGAGPISAGIGYGYREESFTQKVATGPGANVNEDPTYRPVMANDAALGIRGVPAGNMASGNSVEIQFSNVPFARGDQNVHEVFGQLLVPLIADKPFFRQVNLDLSTRWAKYSGAGKVWSWRSGLVWDVFEDVRLRTNISRDVRAATMAEKFDRTGGIGNVTDWLVDPTGSLTYSITRYSGGSPDIQPEDGKTITAGVVYRPRWLKGFDASVDWLSVEITDNIVQLAANDVADGCYLDGDQRLCALITRSGPPSTVPGINLISLVGQPYINQDSVKMVGIDIEMGYRRAVEWLGGGESAGLRLFTTYLKERSYTNAGSKNYIEGTYGLPKWTVLLSGDYTRGPLGIYMQARYTDDQIINRNWNYNGTSTRYDVLDNIYDAEILVNARVNYRFELTKGTLLLYTNINNLFDKQPQRYYAGGYASWFGGGTGLGHAGDLRGRRFVVGLTYEYK